MNTSIEIQNILSQIKKLDYESRLSLAAELIKQLNKINNKDKVISHELTELNTLGSEIWEDVDIDKYVGKEREWD